MRKARCRAAFLLILLACILSIYAPTVSAAEGNIEDYHTILVNPWNKLPEDHKFTLKTVSGSYKVDKRCHADLTEMLSDCRAAGYEPQLCSAYRTNAQQTYLFNNKVREMRNLGYGNNSEKIAAKSIAVPGTSEHQLGLAVDIMDADYPYLNNYQENQDTQKWLMKNSWKYGFTLRYPKGKSSVTGIIYEPWHYRYVGHYLAEVLYRSGLALEEYLEEVPDVPKVTEKNTAAGTVKLSWKADKKAAKYEIYRLDDKSGEFKKLKTRTGTSFEDASVSVGKTYKYKVRAVSKNGAASDFSSIVSVTCRPAAPAPALKSAEGRTVKLTWKSVKSAVKYEIYRRDSKTGSFSKHTTCTGTSFKDTALTFGKTYGYKVRAVSKNGTKSAYSDIISVTCRPCVPTLTGSNSTRGKAKLSWSAVEDAVKYEVYRRDEKTEKFYKLTTRTGTSYEDLTLTPGKTYDYKVRAVSKNGTKSELSATVSVTGRPAKPKLSASLNARGKVKLTWKAAENAVKYEIYRLDPASDTFKRISTRTGTVYENISVSSGKTYKYKIRAVSKDGTKSSYSNTVSVKVN